MGLPERQRRQRVNDKAIQKACGRQAEVWLDEQAVPGGWAGRQREVGEPGFVKIKCEAADGRGRAIVLDGYVSQVLAPSQVGERHVDDSGLRRNA